MNDTEQRKAAKSIIFWRFVSRLNRNLLEKKMGKLITPFG